jgi:hypothetical protein
MPAVDGLQLKTDYRGVNESLWNFWHERYGGGPAVPRKSLDLYGPPPAADVPEEEPVTVEEVKQADPFAEGPEAMNKLFPLRLSFSSQAPAVLASKGLSALFESRPNANEPLNTSEYPYGTVFVNIYDLGSDELGKTINKVSTMNDAVMVGGVFHGGIEVYGFEWSFARIDGSTTGVWRTLPRMELGHSYRATMPLGTCKLSQGEVWQLLDRLSKEWPSEGYDLLRRNCLSFCNAFCDELGVRRIPGWVDRAPRAASLVLDTTAILGCTGRDK